MAQQQTKDVKLGIFLIAGLVVLVLALYMIGKDQHMFTKSFQLRVRFHDVAGLMPGNNVRYSGIQNGTVKSIAILDDTTIEVTMFIDWGTHSHIRKNSVVSIGSEGLMGNKVLNISPGAGISPIAEEGDLLVAEEQISLGAAMGTLYKTNDNAAIISEELVKTSRTINSSPLFRHLLTDTTLPGDIRSMLLDLRSASHHIKGASAYMDGTMAGIRQGEGVVGLLTANNAAADSSREMVENLHKASVEVNRLVGRIDSVATILEVGVSGSSGLMHVLLRDTILPGRLYRSMENVEAGTASFNQNMDALKHNILTRGYFRRLEGAPKK